MKLFYLMMQVLIEVEFRCLFSMESIKSNLFVEDYLNEPLQRFIETLPVRTILLKNEKRLGLISSRVRGQLTDIPKFFFMHSHEFFSGENRNWRSISIS